MTIKQMWDEYNKLDEECNQENRTLIQWRWKIMGDNLRLSNEQILDQYPDYKERWNRYLEKSKLRYILYEKIYKLLDKKIVKLNNGKYLIGYLDDGCEVLEERELNESL